MKRDTNKNEFSWDSISIQKYYDILDILDDRDSDEITKNVRLVSLILDKDEDEVWNMSLPDAGELIGKLRFLNDFKLPEKPNMKISLPGYENLEVMKDVSKITVSQYVDFQAFTKQPLRESFEKILSIFIIPKGKRYNDGYDIIDLQRVIREHLPFVVGQGLLGFFLVRQVEYLNSSLTYLEETMGKTKDGKEMKEIQGKIDQMRKQLEHLMSLPGSV